MGQPTEPPPPAPPTSTKGTADTQANVAVVGAAIAVCSIFLPIMLLAFGLAAALVALWFGLQSSTPWAVWPAAVGGTLGAMYAILLVLG